MTEAQDTIKIYVPLELDLQRDLECIKEHYAIRGNPDMVRVLIREKAREIRAASGCSPEHPATANSAPTNGDGH